MEATMRRHSWTDPRSGKRHEYWTKSAAPEEGQRRGRTFYSFDGETWHRTFKDAAVPVLRADKPSKQGCAAANSATTRPI